MFARQGGRRRRSVAAARAVACLLALALFGWLLTACMGGAEAEPADEAAATATVAPVETSPNPQEPGPAPTATPPLRVNPTLVPTPTPTIQPTAIPPTPTPEPTPTPVQLANPPVIVLDPAHDPTSPGAIGTEYREVLTTALYTKAALEQAGYIVHLTRYNNDTINQENPDLIPPNADEFHPGYSRAFAQASAALQYDPDLVIVLHYNGIDDPTVGGIEVYYCELGNPDNIVLAEIVMEELVTAFRGLGYEPPRARVIEDIAVARGGRHFPSLGNVYDAPRTWLANRYSHIPVVLTEPLYMTNPTEYALLQDPATHIALAEAYVRAVDRYFGRQ